MSWQIIIILLHFDERMYDSMEMCPEPRAIKIQRNMILNVLKQKFWMILNLGDETHVSSMTYRFLVVGH